MSQKKTTIKVPLSLSSGQATVEYILMLVIIVGIALMLSARLFAPLGSFVNNYLGAYVQCLLETGALPGDTNEECTQIQKSASSAFGSAAQKQSSGNSSSISSSSSSSNQSSNPKHGYAGSGGGLNNGIFGTQRGAPGGATADGRKGKVTYEIDTNNGGSGNFYKQNKILSVAQRGKTQSLGLDGLTYQDRKKVERLQKDSKRTIASGEEYGAPARKIALKPPQSKFKDGADGDDTPIGLGGYLRFLLIAIIILVILIVIGGQALELSKGWEK